MQDDSPAGAALQFTPSRMFSAWLRDQNASIAFTTYQANKIFFIGADQKEDKLAIFERSFERCMGLGYANGQLWMSSLFQLWRFENFLSDGETRDGYDAVFVPIEGRTTGDIDIHDVHPVAGRSAPVFVVTRFNCLATLDAANSFAPIWKPPFIDRIAAEDRCHLNGLAMRDEKPAYVSCVSSSNISAGWRDHRRDGGIIIDVEENAVIASGLSMPHSPRWHDGTLYVLQSGKGEFGKIDMNTGKFEPMCFLPGFARGVTFLGRHAIIGVSRPREKTFEGLELDERLSDAGVTPRCQLAVVNLDTGDVEHALNIDGAVQELYDVASIPGVRKPMALGFKTSEIRFQIRPAPLHL